MNALLPAPERTITSTPVALPSTASVLGQAADENFPGGVATSPPPAGTTSWRSTGSPAWPTTSATRRRATAWSSWTGSAAELDRASRGVATHPLLVRLTPTIRQFDLPLDPFQRLIEANRRDQVGPSLSDVRRSDRLLQAVGRAGGELVLRIFEVSSPARIALSDDVCNGLQIVEHLQDVAEDIGGRSGLSAPDDLHSLGCPKPSCGPGPARLSAPYCATRPARTPPPRLSRPAGPPAPPPASDRRVRLRGGWTGRARRHRAGRVRGAGGERCRPRPTASGAAPGSDTRWRPRQDGPR